MIFVTSDWRDLSVEQEKYLIQVRPPGDVMTGAIRTLVINQNISSAAVIYDDTFGRTLLSSPVPSHIKAL